MPYAARAFYLVAWCKIPPWPGARRRGGRGSVGARRPLPGAKGPRMPHRAVTRLACAGATPPNHPPGPAGPSPKLPPNLNLKLRRRPRTGPSRPTLGRPALGTMRHSESATEEQTGQSNAPCCGAEEALIEDKPERTCKAVASRLMLAAAVGACAKRRDELSSKSEVGM